MRVLTLSVSVELIPGSSMVEQEAVNFEVTGSSPVRGANQKGLRWRTFLMVRCLRKGFD